MTLGRHDAAASLVHHATFQFTCPYFTYYGLNWGELGEKGAKNPIFTKIWRHYVMTQVRHEIFFHGYTCLYTICIFSEGLKPIGGRASHREPFFEAISSILQQKLLTFLSHNSGTAGLILDPKVALEKQFIGLSLNCISFLIRRATNELYALYSGKSDSAEKWVLTWRRYSVATGGRRAKKIYRKIPLQNP